jgi:Ca-activated chloride channel homolog
MEWQHPEYLYWILPLCAAWFVLALHSNRRRRQAREAFASEAMWSRILPAESDVRFWIKLLLREIAIVTGLVALAGPRFGTEYEQVIPRGADLYVLIDVSRSMLADDVPPSRLGRAKADVSSLLNRLQGERVGLIAFAGQAVVKCPLTVDYDSFRRSLEELDPDSAPRGGTAIGDAIRKGLEVFHTNADRDQAMILITDGDDQQSYPLEAAAVARERHVTIFTIGLGDAERGARIPQKGDKQSYIEYQGEQVWSKLDGSLLEQIALNTSGVYVPAGTRAYDLGELYTNHLQGRHGPDSATQQKIRRSERFQIFLAMALAALLMDLWVPLYRKVAELPQYDQEPAKPGKGKGSNMKPSSKSNTTIAVLLVLNGLATVGNATEPNDAIRNGLRFYSKAQYDEAKSQFAAAGEELDKRKSAAAAIAAYDEACALHRKGDLENARDCYLKAGLSQDRSIATAAHFNLGTLAAEKARSLSGEKPELVPPEKQKEILDQLSHAVQAYRHCLELQSDHAPARRNIELVRQWIKYYTDKWRERERQKRRDESNLVKFLEFLVQTQTALKETVSQLPEPAHSDVLAELKRAQEELREELPTLREKIETELRPQPDPQTGAVNAGSKELEEGIKLLQSWSDSAGEKMTSASRRLGKKETAKAATDQQTVIDELDKIWEAVIPFHPLLAKDLADQTMIAGILMPGDSPSHDSQGSNHRSADQNTQTSPNQTAQQPQTPSSADDSKDFEISDEVLSKLEEVQSKTLKRTRLLIPKARSELNQMESAASAQDHGAENQDLKNDANDTANGQIQTPETQAAKAGYLKAIELGPQAVDEMESAIKSMKGKDLPQAGAHAEEARRILVEIQKAQPEKEQKQDQNKQDQEKNEDQKNEDQKQGDDKKDEQQKSDEKKQDQNKNDDQSSKKQDQQKQQAQVSQDRMEDALRKVRERQQEKRERDRKLKGQILGRVPVDKDW